MQTTFALVAGLAAVAYAAPQGVTAVITPTASAPSGCATGYSGTFEITALNISSTTKRDLAKRAALTLTLSGGKLLDAVGRTGYIASNNQFQFDNPPQTGAIYTAGFSACSNYSLALGGSALWWQCPSGNPDGSDDGAFYNIYNDKAFDTCTPALLQILPQGSSSGVVSQQSDGQPTGQSATVVSQITDGQAQAPSGAPVTQISDGQIQVPTGVPITQISDGQIQVPTGVPITQISDGQIQVPTGVPVSQISDGQIQAGTTTPSGPVVSQISDGQIQAGTSTPSGQPITQISDGQIQAGTSTSSPSGQPISQISDGQIQAGTSTASSTPTGAPITQITDGQIQAPSATGAVISQISDGQIQAPTATTGSNLSTTTSTPIQVTNASNNIKAGIASVFVAVLAVALL